MNTKKFLLIVNLMACLVSGAYAQYQKGDIAVNAGITFGLIGYGYGLYGSSSGFPPLSVNAEYSINDKFAVGPYVGLYTRSYKYGSGYNDRFTALSFGARGTFHATPFLNETLNLSIDEEKIDLYGTVILGFESYSWNFDEKYGGNYYYSNGSRIIFGPILGVLYNLNPSLGIFFEGGRGAFGYGTLGVTAKL